MIIALSGPSGIGKGYFKESVLLKHPEVKELIWYTTRTLRPNEKNRKSVSDAEFDELLKSEKMVLVQEMFGHRYGVHLDDLIKESGIWLTEVHPYVVMEAKRINPQIVTIGMLTEDLGLLRERLVVKRKTEKPDEIEIRLSIAKSEMNAIKENSALYDKILVITRENEHLVANMAQELFRHFVEERGE